MPVCRLNTRAVAVAGLALCATLLAPGTASAGFLEDLFGNRQDSPAAMPYASTAVPAAEPRQVAVPTVQSVPSVGAGSVTFCVRLCDGRFFPLQRHAGATPIQMCNAFCPAAQTKVFTGAQIDHASASDGARYADLENAFVYRKTIVPGCTCNGRDTFGLAPIDIARDTTLRPGDIVVTATGAQRFTGSQAQLRQGGGFTPVPADDIAGAPRRVAATGLAKAD